MKARKRAGRLTQVFLVLAGVLVLRLFQLQVVQGNRHSALSDRNRIRKLVLPGPRGRVFDRRGNTIADTRPSFTVSVIPTEMSDSTLPALARILGIKEDEMRDKVSPVSFMSSPVKVRRNVDRRTILAVEANSFRLPGVRTSVDPSRSYPYGERFCHALGHLGEVGPVDLERDSLLRALDYVGRSGIEARYESMLRGIDGYEYIEVDVFGHEIGPLPEKRPIPAVAGKDLHLTLDPALHQQAYWLTTSYARASVVALDARSGAVLCLFSRPGFDPNLFTSRIPEARWDSLASNPDKPLFNRAVSAGYPPGSILKPLVALAALDNGVVTPETRYEPCRGKYRYGNRDFSCWNRHGTLDLLGAITHSCNVYFYQLGLELGLDSLAAYCRRFPLGRKTGIDLPGEVDGNLPDRAWLDDRYGAGEWKAGVLLNLAIGQGEILATPLQMAVAYSVLANRGFYFSPHVLARVDSAGKTSYRTRPKRVEVPLDQRNLSSVSLALERVVEYGTARTARLREITIAGKTGTAQNPGGLDHAWFVGYAPADQPEIVIAVLVENSGHGGVVAAPIARQLFRTWFMLADPEDQPG